MNVLSKWSPREAWAGKRINLKEMRDTCRETFNLLVSRLPKNITAIPASVAGSRVTCESLRYPEIIARGALSLSDSLFFPTHVALDLWTWGSKASSKRAGRLSALRDAIEFESSSSSIPIGHFPSPQPGLIEDSTIAKIVIYYSLHSVTAV